VSKENEKKPSKPSVDKNTLKTAKRLLGYVTKTYKVQFIIVLICILVSSVATISVSLSLKFLLDDYIIPLIGQKSPDYTELYQALGILACSAYVQTFHHGHVSALPARSLP